MTIEELIEELEKYPKDAKIFIDYINRSMDLMSYEDTEKEKEVKRIDYSSPMPDVYAPDFYLSTYEEWEI